MFAKKSIKRAEARYFHIHRNYTMENQMSNFIPYCGNYEEYDHIHEHNNKQRELVRRLMRLTDEAYLELITLRELPFYKKIFKA